MTTVVGHVDITPGEGLRQSIRHLWSDPRNTAFRAALRAQPENLAWATRNGEEPLPEVAGEAETPTCGHTGVYFPLNGNLYCAFCAPHAFQAELHRGHADEPADVDVS